MAREAEGKGKIASIIRSMEQTELLRRLFRNIKYMEGKTRGGCTNQVTVTTQDGMKTEYTSRADVESQIIKETEKKIPPDRIRRIPISYNGIQRGLRRIW